jgi:hypothetical protein
MIQLPKAIGFIRVSIELNGIGIIEIIFALLIPFILSRVFTPTSIFTSIYVISPLAHKAPP